MEENTKSTSEIREGNKLLTAEYLTENNLWDSEWLQKKYTHRFNTQNTQK